MPSSQLASGYPEGCSVLFDLDGTFADTAQDMAFAINRLLELRDRAPLPFEEIRPRVSHGGRALVQLAFGLEPGDAGYEDRRREFLDIYSKNLANHTVPFPGISDLLSQLESEAIPWGIVTNKPAWLTDPLMAAMGLAERAACVVSGDTTPTPKPHPAPIHHACRLIGRDPASCWYVGDAERDIVSGRAAGTGTLVALFGYIGDGTDPGTWGADGLIETPIDVLDWLTRLRS